MLEFRLPAQSVRKERLLMSLLCLPAFAFAWFDPRPHTLAAMAFAVGTSLAIGNWLISHCANKIVIRLTAQGISGTDRNGKSVDLRWDEPVSLVKGANPAMIKSAALFSAKREISMEIPLAILHDPGFTTALQRLAPAKHPLRGDTQKTPKPALAATPRQTSPAYTLSLIVRTNKLVWCALGAFSLAVLLYSAKQQENFDLGLFMYQHNFLMYSLTPIALSFPLQFLAKHFYGKAIWEKYESTFTLKGINLPPGTEFYPCMTAANTSSTRKLSGILFALLYPVVFVGLGAMLGFCLWQWAVTSLELSALAKTTP